jgi:hypothetical protein
MLVQGSLFPLIFFYICLLPYDFDACSRKPFRFDFRLFKGVCSLYFLFSKIVLLMVCSRESVPFAWVCMYICTAGLQLVFDLYNSYI